LLTVNVSSFATVREKLPATTWKLSPFIATTVAASVSGASSNVSLSWQLSSRHQSGQIGYYEPTGLET
jgi:hypothetical protein